MFCGYVSQGKVCVTVCGKDEMKSVQIYALVACGSGRGENGSCFVMSEVRLSLYVCVCVEVRIVIVYTICVLCREVLSVYVFCWLFVFWAWIVFVRFECGLFVLAVLRDKCAVVIGLECDWFGVRLGDVTRWVDVEKGNVGDLLIWSLFITTILVLFRRPIILCSAHGVIIFMIGLNIWLVLIWLWFFFIVTTSWAICCLISSSGSFIIIIITNLIIIVLTQLN